MIRTFNATHTDNKYMIRFCKKLQLGVEVERLLGLVVIFFLFVHVMACAWILVGDKEGADSWIIGNDAAEESDFDLYVISVYFIITTFSTVGYGDITPSSTFERVFTIWLEIFGIIFFSFAISSLTSIIAKMNKYGGELRRKLDILEDVKRKSSLGPGLFDLARQCLVYNHKQNKKESLNLIEDLPYRLQVEIAAYLMKSKIANIKFFKEKQKDFIAFVIPLISLQFVRKGMYVFREGETVNSLYFLVDGEAAYGVESDQTIIYISCEKGDAFGLTDFVKTKSDSDSKFIRKFSVIAITDCETVKLSTEDISLIKAKFPKVYDEIFDGAEMKFKKALYLKKGAVKKYLSRDKDMKIKTKNGQEVSIDAYYDAIDKDLDQQNMANVNSLEKYSLSEVSEEYSLASDVETSAKDENLMTGKSRSSQVDTDMKAKINDLDQRMATMESNFNEKLQPCLDQILTFMKKENS